MSDPSEFRRTNLQAFALLGRAKDLVGQDYWVFLGITAVGILLASFVPLGILLGPMMVGIHMSYAAKQRGEKVEFAILFKGFDKFLESLIASLIVVFGSLLVMSPAIVLYMVAIIGLTRDGGEGNGALFALVMLVFYAAIFVIAMIIGALFMFVYPLIADRDVSGLEAVKLSIRSVLGNLWGVVRVSLVNGLLGFLGALVCGVGAFFVLPLSMGLVWLAYREVFPDSASRA